jgi:two-component sensor histidine kinase
MWTVHDATEARDKEQELKAKLAMIQEVHHRVKNSLQSIASLLRLQVRRADAAEVRQALLETVNRILSVAVVHEFFSYNSISIINLRDVAQRILDQMAESIMDPGKSIQFRLTGPGIYLSSQQATACALVINELLLNSVEHGYEHRDVGLVTIDLADDGEWVNIEVGDDGTGLPAEFDLDEHGGLGLRIVRTLVQGDLKGNFELRGEEGVRAIVAFPKTSLGGAKS